MRVGCMLCNMDVGWYCPVVDVHCNPRSDRIDPESEFTMIYNKMKYLHIEE